MLTGAGHAQRSCDLSTHQMWHWCQPSLLLHQKRRRRDLRRERLHYPCNWRPMQLCFKRYAVFKKLGLSRPIMWVPRKAKQAATDIFHVLLADAIQHSSAESGDVDAEVAHRLLRASPQLLCRSPPDEDITQ